MGEATEINLEIYFSAAEFPYLTAAHGSFAALVELAFVVARQVVTTGPIALRDLEQHAPLAFDARGGVTVVASAKSVGDRFLLSIVSRADANVVVHVTGWISSSTITRAPFDDRARDARVVTIDAGYARDVDAYNVHPALIQAALASLASSDHECASRECMRIDNVTFFAPAGERASMRVRSGNASSSIVGDVSIVTKTGTVAACFDGVALGAPTQTAPAIVVRRSRLSSMQQGFLFNEQLSGTSSVNNIALGIRAEGVLDFVALERAFNAVVARHESLRTTFIAEGEETHAVVAAEGAIRIAQHDLTYFPESEREAEAARRIAIEARCTFDLARGPLMRVTTFKIGAREYSCVVVVHHIVSDGWSLGVFMRELVVTYASDRSGAPAPLLPVKMQFGEFATAQEKWLASADADRELEYWKRALAGAPELIDLPTDRPRPPIRSSRGALIPVAFGRETTRALKALFRKSGVTPYVGLLAIFQTLLHRYSRQEQIVTGSAMAGRSAEGTQDVLGPCLNMVALYADFANDPTFAELLARVREVALHAVAHSALPFDRVATMLAANRDPSYSPIFQTCFTFQNSPLDLRLPEVALRLSTLDTGATHFDLQLLLSDSAEGFAGTLSYSTDLFDASYAESLVRHLVALSESAAKNADARVSTFSLIDDREVARIVELCNPRAPQPSDAKCLHEVFEEQARLRPTAIAASFEGKDITYAALDRRANQLAHYLRKRGVVAETRVAFCVERSFDLLVTVLAILKAGGAYVPIDPAYPKDRVAHMLSDTAAPFILAHSSLTAKLPAYETVLLDRIDAELDEEPTQKPPTEVTDANAAYVIFTSGSTGKSKGCVIEHRHVLPLFREMQPIAQYDHRDVWTLFHSIAFDFSVWEIWGALLFGGRIVIVPFLVSRSPEEFHELLCDEGVTILNQTPSAFRQLDQADEISPRSGDLKLRRVMLAGEAVETKMLKSWWARHGEIAPRLMTLYGITETSVLSTFKHLSCEELTSVARCPIGESIPGWRHYVLDANKRPVPVGLCGELYVGGVGVGRGYLNRDELTRERFLPDPWNDEPGARMYKSGDLVRLLADGSFDYLGRMDMQVKIRGFRIEIGEIEAALGRHPAVRNALVVARKKSDGDNELVAYLVVAGKRPTTTEIKDSLQAALPPYMVPAHVVFLDALPLTPNGKVDRKSLPDPSDEAAIDNVVRIVAPAENDLQRELIALWEDVLRVKPIGIHDDFFEIGGTSLVAMRLFLSIKKKFGKSLPVATLFHNPTVAAIADVLGDRGGARISKDTPASPLVEIQRGRSSHDPPIFFVHPSGGDVFVYKELARALGREQSFYGLRLPTLDDAGRRFDNIESMAREYVAAIRKKQPKGPYLLGGWSMGGIVALEIARQLETIGERVEHTIMLDSQLDLVGGTTSLDHDELARMFVLDLVGLLTVDADRLGENFWTLSSDAQLSFLLEIGKQAGVFPAELGLHDLQTRRNIFVDNILAMARYKLPLLRSPLTLIAAEQTNANAAPRDLAWLTLGERAVELVPGDHYSIMHAPHVQGVASEIASCLRTYIADVSMVG